MPVTVQPGEVLAVDAGHRLIYDGPDAQGNEMGHIVSPTGTAFDPKQLVQILARGNWRTPDPDPAVVKFAPGLVPVLKHGSHNQKDHGRRFATTVDPAVAAKAVRLVGENGGLSIKMTDGSEPPDGFMVARDSAKFGTALSADAFYGPDGAKALGEFLIKNRSELGSGRAYLGIWHQKTKQVDGVDVPLARKDQVVHLDVTDRIEGRDRAISLGRRRNQISIWDVVNFEEIQTGGTGAEVAKGTDRSGQSQAAVRDDGRRDHGVVGGGPRADGGSRLEPFLKHPGHADQKVHGRKGAGSSEGWAKRDTLDVVAQYEQVARDDWGVTDPVKARQYAAAMAAVYDHYDGPNGTTLRVEKYSGVTDAHVARLQSQIDGLQKAAPVPGMTVEVGVECYRRFDAPLEWGGFAMPGRPEVYLHPRSVKDGLAPDGLMPSALLDRHAYALTHEWGHTIDHRDSTQAAIDHAHVLGISGMARRVALPTRGAVPVQTAGGPAPGARLSVYGATDKYESHAEAFAEFHLNPRSATMNPVVSYFSDKYNWGEGGSGVSKATGPVLVIGETFSADGPAQRMMEIPPPWPLVEEEDEPSPAVVKFAPGLRPVLKHGSPGDKGYAQMHPGGASGSGGGKYAEWGDRAREIEFAERTGPSAETLQYLTAEPTLVPADVDAEVESRYEDEIDELARARYEDWESQRTFDSDDPISDEESQQMMDDIRRGARDDVVNDRRDDVEIEMYEQWHEDRRMTIEEGDLISDFDEVYGASHSVTLDDGEEQEIYASVHMVDYEWGYYSDPGEVVVRGMLSNADGDQIGEFERRFRRSDGQLVVSHELLVIQQDEYQGKGFAAVFNRQAENYYASHGVAAIRVHAALDGGGYAWARQGFDFTNPGNVPYRLELYLADRGDRLPKPVKDDLVDISRRFALSRSDPDYPTPAEVAMLGHVPGATTWPGKTVMRGSDWFGAKPVTPTARKSTTQAQKEWEQGMAAHARDLTRAQIPGQTSLDADIASQRGQSPGQKPLFSIEPSTVDAGGNVQ